MPRHRRLLDARNRGDLRTTALATAICVAAGSAYAEDLAPKEAGARYGQAIGASLACRGARTTPALKGLEGQYQGVALEQFKMEAVAVERLWRIALSCGYAREINACRLMMERNCVTAAAEIGPNGTARPGLLEFADADEANPRP